jgi:HSP20 family molecular chaperone IbpA
MNQDQAKRDEAALLPPVDVIEDSTGITLYADLPGVSKDRLNLQVDGETLTIEGEMTFQMPQGMEATHAEVSLPRFRRVFTLSKELDTGKLQAELKQGVLKLRIQKAEHAKPRKIVVQDG